MMPSAIKHVHWPRRDTSIHDVWICHPLTGSLINGYQQVIKFISNMKNHIHMARSNLKYMQLLHFLIFRCLRKGQIHISNLVSNMHSTTPVTVLEIQPRVFGFIKNNNGIDFIAINFDCIKILMFGQLLSKIDFALKFSLSDKK